MAACGYRSTLRIVFTARRVISRTPVKTSTGFHPRVGDLPTLVCRPGHLSSIILCISVVTMSCTVYLAARVHYVIHTFSKFLEAYETIY